MKKTTGVERSINSTDHMKVAAYQELQDALRINEVNEELFEHLVAALRWIQHYVKKHDMPMPEKETIERLLDRAEEIENKLPPSIPDDG